MLTQEQAAPANEIGVPAYLTGCVRLSGADSLQRATAINSRSALTTPTIVRPAPKMAMTTARWYELRRRSWR